MNQKIIALFLAGLSLFPLTTPISAQVPDSGIIAPYWNYMGAVDIEFNFFNSTASLLVERRSQVTTKIEGTLTIYKKVGNRWVYVASDSDSSTRTLSFDVEFDAVSGVTYKAVADVTAYGTGGSESDSVSEIQTCP